MKGGAEPKDGASLVALLRWDETVGWVESMGGSWLETAPTPSPTRRAQSMQWTKGDDAFCLADADCTVAVAPKLDGDGELVCGKCPPCGLRADTAMATVTAQRIDALCSARRAAEGSAAACEACAPTQKKAQCKAMRCVMKP
jgi:hypothetical protein